MNERIGVFGGSFNPVHIGHIRLVEELLKSGKIDRLLIVPTYQNPLKHRNKMLPDALRMQLLKEVFVDIPKVEISKIEIDREGVSYSLDTLKEVAAEKRKLLLVMGSDTYGNFDRWKNPQEIVNLSRLLVFRRIGGEIETLPAIHESIAERVTFLDVKLPEACSSIIRKAIELDDYSAVRNIFPEPLVKITRGYKEAMSGANRLYN